VALRSEDPQLINRVINFECSRYINVTDGQTNGQTDGRLTIAISRFALRDSVVYRLERRTCDQAVVGLIFGRAVIKLLRSTQSSIPPAGVGKSSTGVLGWGYGGARSIVSGGR